MKNRFNSIQTQLLVNLLLPALFVLLVVFVIFYRFNIEQLELKTKTNRSNILEETKNLIAFYDHSIRQHENDLIGKMRLQSFAIQKRLAREENLKKVDLFLLSKEQGIDTNKEHIYLINQNTKIINTTFEKDFGMKFSDFGKTYISEFARLRAEKKFHEDRFGLESRTGKIKKYSFLPTLDGKYLIELGYYSSQADGYRALLLKQINSLSDRFPGINSSYLYLSVKGVRYSKLKGEKQVKAYFKCLNSRKNQEVITDNPKTRQIEKVEYLFLPVLKSNIYVGYILQLETDNSEEQKLLSNLFYRFLIIGLVSLFLLFTLIIWRTKKIAKPIQLFSQQTQDISVQNLNQQITVNGSKEINELKESFNAMIQKLKLSYESLEEKVIARTKELNTQKQLVEHKNQEITESIQYAKFIQDALLPSEKLVKNGFPNSFIYFQPKDIIAGDFYWYVETTDWNYIAVADCTGHGVPGAMVSILCISSLNEAMAKLNCCEPSELLNLTRQLVVEKLTKEHYSLKDGMDISILRMNKENKTIQWAGANNPMWIFNGKEIQQFQADKQPVGQFDGFKSFTTHTYFPKENDLFVLFSDGYADQFGGPKDKKFKYSSLRELISEIAHLPMNEIENQLHQRFSEWKGENEQTDDVCVVGFK